MSRERTSAADVVAREAARAPDVVALAELCALAARVEPFLIRRLRRALLPAATTATEADLWTSRLVEATSRDGITFEAGCARELRRRAGASPLLEAAIAEITAAHAEAPPSLRLEEELIHLGVRPTVDEVELDKRLAQIAKAFVDSPDRSDAIALWVSRFLPRLPPPVTALPGARALGIWAAERLGGGTGVDDGADLGDWRAILEERAGPGEVAGVRLLPSGVEVSWPPGEPAHEIDTGPPPVTLDLDVPDGTTGITVRPRRGEPSRVPLTVFTLPAGDGAAWLDDREVRQLAGDPGTPIVAALDTSGGVAVWDVDRQTRTRLAVTGAEVVAVAASDGEVTVLVGRPGTISAYDPTGAELWAATVPEGRFDSLSAGGGPVLRWVAVVGNRLVGGEGGAEGQWVQEGRDYFGAVLAPDGSVAVLTPSMVQRRAWGGSLTGSQEGRSALALAAQEDAHGVLMLSNRPEGEAVSVLVWGGYNVDLATGLEPGCRLVPGARPPAWIDAGGRMSEGPTPGTPPESGPAPVVRAVAGAVMTSRGVLIAGTPDRIEARTRRGERHLIEVLPSTLLGPSVEEGGTSFRVMAPAAEEVDLCLIDVSGAQTELPMRPDPARGDWWVRAPGVGPGQRYGFRVSGPAPDPSNLLLDPYARAVQLGTESTAPDMPLRALGVVVDDRFDWADDRRPATPWADTILYEVPVKGATMLHPDVPPEVRGTYAGFAHPSFQAHLTDLGVTAVVLLPTQAFLDSLPRFSPVVDDRSGFDTIAYLSPNPDHAASQEPEARAREFKQMVRACHRNNVEVILDVAFNQTAEHEPDTPTISLRGFDPRYYRAMDVLDVHWPPVTRLVLDTLRYWAEEMHVDGFRFRRMQTLLIRPDGRPGGLDAPILDLIRREPGLQALKLIGEPSGLGPTVTPGGIVPRGWAEMNVLARQVVFSYWSGVSSARDLAAVLGGSEGRYHVDFGRTHLPVNAVTAQDGATLVDSLGPVEPQFEQSVREAAEPPTGGRPEELSLLASVLLARGVPMLRAGDELGQTRMGVPGSGRRDDEPSWLPWDRQPWTAAIRRIVDLRRRFPELARPPGSGGLTWLAPDGGPLERPDTDDPIALAMHVAGSAAELLVCFNPKDEPVAFVVPDRPGWRWAETAAGPVEPTVSVDAHGTRVLEGAPAPAPPRPSGRPGVAGDVLIVVPGFGGSTLARDGRELWGTSVRALFRTFRTLGSSITDLTLHGDDPDLDVLEDGVVATGLVPDLPLGGSAGYSGFTDWLRTRFQGEAGLELVTFAWDWRRDMRVAAHRLSRVAAEALAGRRAAGYPNARLIILGHEFGGLVASWFTDVLEGHRDTRALLCIGTPFAGTVSQLDWLVNGWRPAGRLGPDLTEFVRSLTSSYQVLANYPCVDMGDGTLRRLDEVTLPNVDRARVEAGQEFLGELDDKGASRAAGSAMRAVYVVGDGQPTPLSARLVDGRLQVVDTMERVGAVTGDGTVARFSATPRWEGAEVAHLVKARSIDLLRDATTHAVIEGVVAEAGEPVG